MKYQSVYSGIFGYITSVTPVTMNKESIAPCGVICDICIGFQRTKNKCVGCNSIGNKPYHCRVCNIKLCPEKNGNEQSLCHECNKFPCRRIKDLNKRYVLKYGESLIENLQSVKDIGAEEFIEIQKEKWKCKECGLLLCVHRDECVHCGSTNQFYPVIDKN